MKRLIFFLTILFVSSFSSQIHAQNLQNFTITSFTADYYISKDAKKVSQLKVEEKITAQFPDYDQNHGIERAIPQKYKDNSLNIKINSVKKLDGTSWNYTTYNQNDNIVVRIGDADKYVRGSQTFIINYSVRDVITFYPDHDEWYWDVNGDQWSQPFGQVQARVHVPNDLASKQNKQPICFTGFYGQNNQDCTTETIKDSNETITTFSSTRSFVAGENLSFVFGFEPETFSEYKLDPKLVIILVIVGLILLLSPPILVFIIMYRKWSRQGRDPKGRGIIVPQYKAQKYMDVLQADVILNQRLSTKSISAAMLDLCIQGYLKLYEIKKDKFLKDETQYELEIVRDISGLSSTYSEVIKLIFTSNAKVGDRINLNQQKNKLYQGVGNVKTTVNKYVVDFGFFKTNPSSAGKSYIASGTSMMVVGFAFCFIVFPWLIIPGLSLVVAGLIMLIFGVIMPARTVEGLEAKEYLLGMRDYMNMAEKDRIAYLQGPETAEKINTKDSKKLIKLYEQLLPYAMLFNIEKDWAKQFAALYKQGESPGWYSGHSTFNAVLFSNAVSGFSSASVSSFSAPSSSGSSGYSGGGGFSGGGGGGGGGGGW